METLNSNSSETESVPASVPAPVATVPEATAAPVMKDATIVNAAPAAIKAPTATAAPAQVPVVKGELPKTTGSTPGGWNRFAGYDRNAAKNKSNDRGSKGKR